MTFRTKLPIQVFFIHLLLFIVSKDQEVCGFELVSLQVHPERPRIGDDLHLQCIYLLDQGEQLYSLKWNKKDSNDYDKEFYRFSSRRPVKQKFPLGDLDIDITRSSDGKVVLRNVTEFASGVYKCEITAAVTFRTLAKEVSITISDYNHATINRLTSPTKIIIFLILPFFLAILQPLLRT